MSAGPEHADGADAEPGHQQADPGARHRDQRALGEKLPHDGTTRGPECGTDGDLTAT